MKFALLDDQKTGPIPKTTGICQFCGALMISKCGNIKIWHWAHKSKLDRDPWWENETEWHRQWKANFPDAWQEVIHICSDTREKHIADVKTPHGLVIEFQHSPKGQDEMKSRENFYGNMIWIVNGDDKKTLNKSYFMMGLDCYPIQKNPLAYQLEWWGRSQFLANWGKASAKVYLDFGDNFLCRLVLYNDAEKVAVVGPIAKERLIEDCLAGQRIHVSCMDEDSEPPKLYQFKLVERTT